MSHSLVATPYVEHHPPAPVRPGRLWFGVAGPAASWSLHLVFGYILAGLHCSWCGRAKVRAG